VLGKDQQWHFLVPLKMLALVMAACLLSKSWVHPFSILPPVFSIHLPFSSPKRGFQWFHVAGWGMKEA
jgi:hypothetical protein